MSRTDHKPRLVATDLDGTFLSPDGGVSAENRAAVQAAQEAGTYVVFVTGRPVRWLDVIQDLPGAHPTVIASNGAVLVRPRGRSGARSDLPSPLKRHSTPSTGSGPSSRT